MISQINPENYNSLLAMYRNGDVEEELFNMWLADAGFEAYVKVNPEKKKTDPTLLKNPAQVQVAGFNRNEAVGLNPFERK